MTTDERVVFLEAEVARLEGVLHRALTFIERHTYECPVLAVGPPDENTRTLYVTARGKVTSREGSSHDD